MKLPKLLKSDRPAIAMLARIESHVCDQRRRSIWLDRQQDFLAFDAALTDIRRLSRVVRLESAAKSRAEREARATARLGDALSKAA